MRTVSESVAEFPIRAAVSQDAPAIEELIDRSVRELQKEDYSAVQIEGALGTVFGVDTQLIADGTYFVVEVAVGGAQTMAGCGGWSKRKTLFGGNRQAGREDELLDPATDAAKIRAFFVHPDWARRGIGSRILTACENAAVQAGFRRFELGATLTGERLYRQKGYAEIERLEVPLANGARLPIIRMSKWAGVSSQ
jgi:GNAT superfamily N-acetyltransferase